MERQVQFNRPVTLSDMAGKVPAQTFGKGTHPVPEALTKGWFFAALVKDGHVITLREATPEKPVPAAPADAGAPVKGEDAGQATDEHAAPENGKGKKAKER